MTSDQPAAALELSTATGANLDVHGKGLGIIRNEGEPDEDYRIRLIVFINSRRAPKDREWQ